MDQTMTTTRTVRFLGKCKGCGAKHAVELIEERREERYPMRVERRYRVDGYNWSRDQLRHHSVVCPCDGRRILLARLVGRVSEKHKCGSRCLSSTGPTCECQCGGKNHGRNYVHVGGAT